MHFAPDVLARVASRLPSGYTIADLVVVETESVITTELSDADVQQVLASVKLAAPPMINADNRPTVLKIAAWMCHGDVPNGNGDAFVGAELERLAPTLFASPNYGVMDWNHAAVLQQGDPPLIGVWHKADWAYHASAYDGKGAWGLLVSGVMFAWLFPEIADALLAEQARTGTIKGSMACVPKSVEVMPHGDRTIRVLHNPVFFTHSLLSNAPADPSATGVCTEDPEVADTHLVDQCLMGEPAMADAEDAPEDALDEELAGLEATPELTHFPVKGENRPISLRYSKYRVAPLALAEELQQHWPEIWAQGGNVRGNDTFAALAPLVRAGGKPRNDDAVAAVRLREAWAARHRGDHRLPGVVAQLKWLVVSDRGLDHMKRVISEAKDAVRASRAATAEVCAAALEEATMDDELMNQLEQANAELTAAKDALEADKAALAARVAELEAAVADLLAKAAEVEQAKATAKPEKADGMGDGCPMADCPMKDQQEMAAALQTALDEMRTAKEALATELTALQAQLVEAQARITEYETREAEEAAVKAEQDKAARLAARIAELPEAYRLAHAKREESVRGRIESHWAGLTEEEWELKKEELVGGFAPSKVHFVARSHQDGVLPIVEQSDALRSKIAAHIK